MPLVRCPKCGYVWEYRGRKGRKSVTCPSCRTTFKLEDMLKVSEEKPSEKYISNIRIENELANILAQAIVQALCHAGIVKPKNDNDQEVKNIEEKEKTSEESCKSSSKIETEKDSKVREKENIERSVDGSKEDRRIVVEEKEGGESEEKYHVRIVERVVEKPRFDLSVKAVQEFNISDLVKFCDEEFLGEKLVGMYRDDKDNIICVYSHGTIARIDPFTSTVMFEFGKPFRVYIPTRGREISFEKLDGRYIPLASLERSLALILFEEILRDVEEGNKSLIERMKYLEKVPPLNTLECPKHVEDSRLVESKMEDKVMICRYDDGTIIRVDTERRILSIDSPKIGKTGELPLRENEPLALQVVNIYKMTREALPQSQVPVLVTEVGNMENVEKGEETEEGNSLNTETGEQSDESKRRKKTKTRTGTVKKRRRDNTMST